MTEAIESLSVGVVAWKMCHAWSSPANQTARSFLGCRNLQVRGWLVRARGPRGWEGGLFSALFRFFFLSSAFARSLVRFPPFPRGR